MSIVQALSFTPMGFIPLSPWRQVEQALATFGNAQVPIPEDTVDEYARQQGTLPAHEARELFRQIRSINAGLGTALLLSHEAALVLERADLWERDCAYEDVVCGQTVRYGPTPFFRTRLEIHVVNRTAEQYALGIWSLETGRRQIEAALARHLGIERGLIAAGVEIEFEPGPAAAAGEFSFDLDAIVAPIIRTLELQSLTGAVIARGIYDEPRTGYQERLSDGALALRIGFANVQPFYGIDGATITGLLHEEPPIPNPALRIALASPDRVAIFDEGQQARARVLGGRLHDAVIAAFDLPA